MDKQQEDYSIYISTDNNVNNYEDGDISFHIDGHDYDILKLTKDGFYVRGVKVDVDEDEGHKVYEAFKEFLNGVGYSI